MLITYACDAVHRAQYLLEFVTEHSGTFSVDDADARYVEHYCVVDVPRNLFHRIVEPFAAHVQLGAEIELALTDGCIHLYSGNRSGCLLHGTLELVGRDPFDLVQRHLAADVSYHDHYRLRRDLHHFADHAVFLHTHLLACLERCRTECFHPFLLRLLLTHLLLHLVVGTLCLPLLLALPPGIQLLDLALYVVILLLLFLLLPCGKYRHESLKLLSGLLRGLLLGLGFLDCLDRVLYLPVSALYYVFRLFLGLVEYLLLELLDLLEFLLVLVRYVLQSLVGMLDALELFIQSLPVAGNLAEIPLQLGFPHP